jgi:hypothetical protein
LPAEVIYDALRLATASEAGAKARRNDIRARAVGSLATRWTRPTQEAYSLAIFGKPSRELTCDCDRSTSPSLLQTIYLRNDPEVLALVDRADGWVAEVKAAEKRSAGAHREGQDRPPDRQALVREAYLRTLSRVPEPDELDRALASLDEDTSAAKGVGRLLWALVNTKEFIVNH